MDAATQAGYPAAGAEGPDAESAFQYNPQATRGGRRLSTARAYLRPARNRPNLKVVTGAAVSRVVMTGGAATGIEFTMNDGAHTMRAYREVIVAAGAFNSPQLLQASGIGPAGLLQGLGIPVVYELPGVGENLQDHFGFWVSYRCTRPITVNDVVNDPWRRWAMGLRYLLFRDGLMSINPSYVSGCVRSDPALAKPDIRLNLTLWCRSTTGRAREGFGLHPESSFSIGVTLMHADSRGTVRARSSDVSVAPEIRFGFLESENDRRVSIAAVGRVRRIMSMPAVRPYIVDEIAPGAGLVTESELLQYCRAYGRSNHHPVGSCRMGVEAGSVVDPRLRVHGVRKLRVVDASVMPRIVAVNPNATVAMIAEKGAAMILGDADR